MTTNYIIADFTSQLSVAIAVGGTTGTLVNYLDDDGVAIPTGLVYLTIDGSNSNKEHISATRTAGVLNNNKSVSRQAVETAGAARAHRVGATVVMTDFASYKHYMDNIGLSGVSPATTSVMGGVNTTTNTASSVVVSTDDSRLPPSAPAALYAPITTIGAPTGSILPYAGRTAPTSYLFCDGAAVSRTTYAALFAAICPSMVVTMTIASPGVVSSTAHGMVTGDNIHLTTTGGLPSGLAANTTYFVSVKDANSFWLFDTQAHAATDNGAGSGTGIIVTTGSQSGVHTLYVSNYGKGDGSTTFNTPTLGGKTPFGYLSSDANFNVQNNPNTYVGEKTHVLITAELASHTHGLLTGYNPPSYTTTVRSGSGGS